MDHNQWIERQFSKYFHPAFRDVLIHTGFIETSVEDASIKKTQLGLLPTENKGTRYRSFRSCIRDLGFSESDDLVILYNKRDEVVHRIIKESLDKKGIEALVGEMHNFIKKIYTTSDLVNNFFFAKYKFYPREKISKLETDDSIET